MRGADASSDHEMVRIRSKIRIKLKKQKQNKDSRRQKYDFKKKNPTARKKESFYTRTEKSIPSVRRTKKH